MRCWMSSHPLKHSRECEKYNMTDLPLSKTWYALDKDTDEIIDQDESLQILYDRINGNMTFDNIVYSKYRIEKVPRK